MLEKEFQNEVIKFLKEQNIYYIKIWRWRLSTFRNTRFNYMLKRKIHSNRAKDRNTENHHHYNYIT